MRSSHVARLARISPSPPAPATLEAAELPAASKAVPVTVWLPTLADAAFQVAEYGDVASLVTSVLSTENSTRATPMLSDAVAARATLPETVAPDAGEVSETVVARVSPVATTGLP